MKRQKYDKNLPRKMYSYFTTYEGTGAPSFSKFARSIGVTTSELLQMRVHKRFDEAYRECSEIRRDYLIDKALCRRADPSLVKFILESEARAERAAEGEGDGELRVLVEVV